jgi:uncharacterized protein with HEPN domain
MQRDKTTLLDIARAARAVVSFTHNIAPEQFVQDLKTQSAVLYQLLVIGEAVKRLSSDFRERHPEIPWGPMAGMRDHLIHGYDLVDWGEVWHTATRDVPDLLIRLAPLLPAQRASNE